MIDLDRVRANPPACARLLHFDNPRPLKPIAKIPPDEAEANFYVALDTKPMAAKRTEISLRQARTGSGRCARDSHPPT